uniref:CSON008491 protein n=1 Tax=Culicoides sonorensis TaxID=179676 RepID=A0A336KIT7_CULSO
MRRNFNGEPCFQGSRGFGYKIPREFGDPFAERHYESPHYGGSYNQFNDDYDQRIPRNEDYSRFDYADRFNGNGNFNAGRFNGNNNGNYNAERFNNHRNYNEVEGDVEQFMEMGNPFSRKHFAQRYGNSFSNNKNQKSSKWAEKYQAPAPCEVETSENYPNEIQIPEFEEPIIEESMPEPKWVKDIPKIKSTEMKCKLCNLMLSSQIVYEAHIQGKKHLKKVADAKQYSCDLCHTTMMSAQEQKEHNETEQHIESVKVAEFFEKQRQEEKELEKKKMESSKPFMTPEELQQIKSIANPVSQFKCDICNVTCNSQPNLDAHLVSKKHTKKVAEHNLNKKASAVQYSCQMCQFLCYSSEEHEAHSNSAEHLKLLGERAKAGTIQAPAVPYEVVAAGISKDELDVVPVKGADNMLWYTCETCNVKCNSLDNYKAHINSKKHKTKKNQPGAQLVDKKAKYSSEALRSSYTRFISAGGLGKKITGDPGSYCARCEIQFKTPTELEEHFLTLAHKNHNPYKKKLSFDTENAYKKAKLSNGESKKPTNNANSYQSVPQVSSNYGYGSYAEQQYQDQSAYQQYSTAYPTADYSNYYNSSGYNAQEYDPNNSYYKSSQTAYSANSQASSYSYAAPFYQH